MTTAAIDIIHDALLQIGQYQPGESVTDADSELGLAKLNDFMDTLTNENLACFCNLQQSTPLLNAVAAYTIGPGGMIDGIRPLKITQMWMRDIQSNTYAISMVTQFDFNTIQNRYIGAQTPTTCFYDPQYPLGIINLWPVPQNPPAYVLWWMSYAQLERFPDLTTEVILPPGYVSMLKPNLAVILAPYFGSQPAEITAINASRTLAAVKRTNIRPVQKAYYDPELCTSRQWGNYNIYGDFWGSRGSRSP